MKSRATSSVALCIVWLAPSCYSPAPVAECGVGLACDAAPNVDASVDAMADACLATTCSNNMLTVCGQVNAVRPPGTGVRNGIFFGTGVTDVGTTGAVFAVGELTVQASTTLRFLGAKPVVLLVDGAAVVNGQFTASADAIAPLVPGPGGGTGGQANETNGTGCGAGQAGTSSDFFLTEVGAAAELGGMEPTVVLLGLWQRPPVRLARFVHRTIYNP